MVVQTVWLQQINYIESIQFAGPRVLNHEVEPLRLPFGVVVRPQYEIILVVVDLDGSFQVRTLEPGLELKRGVLRAFQFVPRWKVLIVIAVRLRWHCRNPTILPLGQLLLLGLIDDHGLTRLLLAAIVNDLIDQDILIRNTLRLPPQAFFHYVFLRYIQWFVNITLQNVQWTGFEKLVPRHARLYRDVCPIRDPLTAQRWSIDAEQVLLQLGKDLVIVFWFLTFAFGRRLHGPASQSTFAIALIVRISELRLVVQHEAVRELMRPLPVLGPLIFHLGVIFLI